MATLEEIYAKLDQATMRSLLSELARREPQVMDTAFAYINQGNGWSFRELLS